VTRHATTEAAMAPSPHGDRPSPPESYQRHFVPVIGLPLAIDLVEAAALGRGERVVDMACGTGVVTRLAAERVGPGGAVTGVDVNPGMLAVARSVAADGATIEWHEADAATTGLPDAAYDVALCQLGLQFFADRTAALRELRRLLVPGGRIAVNVAGPAPPMFEILEHALADHISPDAARFVATVFSISEPSQLEQLLDRAGFDAIAVERRTRRLRLGTPAEFLSQYVSGTPLAPAFAAADERAREALAHEVVARWAPFVGDDGSMVMQFDVPLAVARSG
jgi:ubiquinone/menaquinone biosynthesis C-methylase UbiE